VIFQVEVFWVLTPWRGCSMDLWKVGIIIHGVTT